MGNINCCVVAGLGYMGREHLTHYRALGLRAVAVDSSRSPEDARRAGADALYGSLSEALEAEHPQVVDICLPTSLHARFAVEALRAGCHVLVEKPIALSPQDLRDILDAETRSAGRLMPAHVCRFMAQYRYALETVRTQALGRPVSWNAWRLSETPGWSLGGWLGNQSLSGGTLFDLHIHEIDLALWLFGTPAEGHIVRCRSAALPADGYYEVRSCTRFESGVTACIDASQLMPAGYPFTSGYRLVCERGALEFSAAGDDVRFARFDGSGRTDLLDWYRAQPARSPYELEIRHFLSCIESGAPFDITAAEACAAVEFTRRLSGSELLCETVKPCSL